MFHDKVPYFGYTEQEVKEVFMTLYPRLCAYIKGVTAGRDDLCDDIIQEIFYKFLRRRPCLERSKVPAYLFSMAHNTCLNCLRQNKIVYNNLDLNNLQENSAWETIASCDFMDAANSVPPLASLLVEDVLAFCDQLPPQTARIFAMSRIEGLTNREIAEQLHIAQRTVEKHISLSIKRFRHLPQFRRYWSDSE